LGHEQMFGQTLGTSYTYQKEKSVHVDMCPETFKLWVAAEGILCRHQQQFSINVRAGIVGNCLVGPHVLPHRLTGNNCRDLLLHDLAKLPEDAPVAVRARVWHMHDGGPANFSRAVRGVLSKTCRDRYITRGWPTARLPRSPNFNPKGPWVRSSCRQWRGTSHCGCLSDYPQVPRHPHGCGGPRWDVSMCALNLTEDILSTVLFQL
jgi:hypothetical protein